MAFDDHAVLRGQFPQYLFRRFGRPEPLGGLGVRGDRQREAIEAAYRAGYFDWPRESTAEDVAEALDIAAPTLHAHLRKAQATLLAELFDGESVAD